MVPLTCGSACISADFLDTLTGQIIPGTFSNSGWKERHDAFREIEFRRASKLIVFAGQIDEKGPLGWHFYRVRPEQNEAHPHHRDQGRLPKAAHRLDEITARWCLI